MIKILTALHTLPEIKTYRTIFFEKIIPVLKEKFDVQVYWLVYTPEKLSNSIKEKNDRILDIHDFQNAVGVIEKVKPDIIISAPTLNLPDFALTLAAKFYNIPTAGEVVTKLFVVENTKITLFSFFKGFFSSSVPTDNNEKNKKFMRRGIFFIYKYYFLLKTQKIIKMKYSKILKDFFILIKAHLVFMKDIYNKRFSVDLHFVENYNLKKLLIQKGFKESSLAVTGNPMYDSMKYSVTTEDSLKNHNKINVLLFTHAMYEHGIWTRVQRDTLVKDIVKEVNKHKNEMELVVKIHPSSEILSEYQKIIGPISDTILIHKEGNALEFIQKADVIIGFSTESALIQALILKKPVIICNFYGLQGDLFLKHDLVFNCEKIENLIPSIKKSKQNNPATKQKIEQFTIDYLYKLDGLASKRICNAIIGLLEGKIKNE